MTYRQETQLLINILMAVYDSAEGLRDCATEAEKTAWNNARRILPAVWGPLQIIDNHMSESQANQEVGKCHKLFSSIKID